MADIDLPSVQIYFLTSRKDGDAALEVVSLWATERLRLSLHPTNAVPAVLPLLEPAFAHYVAQWERYMVPDVNETNAVGFTVPAGGMPDHIAPLENWDAINAIAWQHTPEHFKDWWGDQPPPPAISTWDPEMTGQGNIEDFLIEPDELGIDVWQG